MKREDVLCPIHGYNVTKRGYDIGDGWRRCAVDEEDPQRGTCLFSVEAG